MAPPFKFQRKAVAVKLEATYGVDPLPGPTDGVLLRNVEIEPVAGVEVPRDNVKAHLGNDPTVLAAPNVTLQCEVEAAGSGTAGTAPAYGTLLRGCGMAEVIDAGTSVTYNPVSDGEESVAIYFWHAGSRHAILGARGSFGITFAENQVPLYQFAFTGLYVDVVGETIIAPDLSAYQKPLVMSKANTPTFALHGAALALENLTLAMNTERVVRDLVNANRVDIPLRQPGGQVRVESPALGTINVFDIAKNRTTGAVSIVHGTQPGHIVEVDMPAVELANPTYQDSNNVSMLQMDMRALPGAATGNDEVKLTIR